MRASTKLCPALTDTCARVSSCADPGLRSIRIFCTSANSDFIEQPELLAQMLRQSREDLMAFLIASAGNDYLFSSDVGGVKNKPMSTDHRTDAPRRLPRLHLRAFYATARSS